MSRYNLHGRRIVPLLACPGKLAEVDGTVSGMNSSYVSSALKCGLSGGRDGPARVKKCATRIIERAFIYSKNMSNNGDET